MLEEEELDTELDSEDELELLDSLDELDSAEVLDDSDEEDELDSEEVLEDSDEDELETTSSSSSLKRGSLSNE